MSRNDTPIEPPKYFSTVQSNARRRWQQLEADPELAGPWHQLFKQVQSPRHVLSELLQNADDAKATTASAVIVGDEFIFEHDGEDFHADHFESLCRFGYSNKRNLHTIGFRGIGFKSTFSLGDEVRLVSPTLSVAFHKDRFTEPIWVSETPRTSSTQVRVAIKDEHRKQELAKNLDEWASSPLSLLFFQRISALTIGDCEIRQTPQGPGPAPNSEWVTLSDQQKEPYLLIRSEEEEFPDDAVTEIRQERMGADDLELPPCHLNLVLGRDVDARLYVVLPTGVTTKLPFACNAPFVQDPARVKIKDPETSPTNRWLLHRAGQTAARAMLAWLGNTELTASRRSEAYRLLPDVDRKSRSIEGVCAAKAELGFEDAIDGKEVLLTESEGVVKRQQCAALPHELHGIWNADQLCKYFGGKHPDLLSREVDPSSRTKLSNWDLIELVDHDTILTQLERQHLARPTQWMQLLQLWSYVSQLTQQYPYRHSHNAKSLCIVPVQGKNALHSAKETIRLGEKRLLQSSDDWEFLSKYLLVLNPNWTRFLADERRKASMPEHRNRIEVLDAVADLLRRFELSDASDVNKVFEMFASRFFEEEDIAAHDCIRIAQLAAALGAKAPENFEYVTQDGQRARLDHVIICDADDELEPLFESSWYADHALDRHYWMPSSTCPLQAFRKWAHSDKSGLQCFAPIKETNKTLWHRETLAEFLAARAFRGYFDFPYVTSTFSIEDFDFADAHWRHWHGLAEGDPRFWCQLLSMVLKLPARLRQNRMSASVYQISTNRTMKPITNSPILPAWIMKLRELPCLEDTHGAPRQPAELLRRTPATEALLDVEPFIKAELDTEKNRPLLIALGVRDTPTGPDRILERLRALARATSAPVYEIEKWYNRLDELIAKGSTKDAQVTCDAFANDALVLSESNTWCKSSEIFLNPDDDIPGIATIHPAVRELNLWHRVGVAERPTAELALKWLGEIRPGAKLAPDEARRVREFLPRYAGHVWDELHCWLNLESEWVTTDSLSYKLTALAPVPLGSLFATTKRKTADLRKLPAELCDQAPFASLESLTTAIEERVEPNLYKRSAPKRKSWIATLGRTIARIKCDDENRAASIKALGGQLMRTEWQLVTSLESVPYIGSTPVGAARKIPVLWKDETLYVCDDGVAKQFKAIAQELSRPFDRSDIGDAIKACVDRSDEFILDYMSENFTLGPDVDAVDLADDGLEQDDEAESTDAGRPTQGRPAEATDSGAAKRQRDERATDLEIEDEDEEDDGLTADDVAEDESDTVVTRPRTRRANKPRFAEVFAKSLDFQKDGDANRYYHDDGSWIERVEGASFPYQRFDAGGNLVQSYWVKEHCIEHEPLKLGADVWRLCEDAPEAHTLVLAGLDGAPTEYSGVRIADLTSKGHLKLYPAEYRISFDEQAIESDSLT